MYASILFKELKPLANYTMKIETAKIGDGDALAELRVLAMRESLEALGRFDEARARKRFLDSFDPDATQKVLIDDELVGFYVVTRHLEYLYVDHLYVHPAHQGKSIGSTVLNSLIDEGRRIKKPIKLGALKSSRSNAFYLSHDFVKVSEGEYDNYYELCCH